MPLSLTPERTTMVAARSARRGSQFEWSGRMMTIDEIHEHLDIYALQRWRTPLVADPHLWKVFAEDRAQAPYRNRNRMDFSGIGRGPCKVCGRQMRPHSSNPVPGTCRHQGRGLCQVCYKDHRDEFPAKGHVRKPIPPYCLECGTRQYHPKERPPNGRAHHGNGVCNACVKKADRARAREERLAS